MNKRIKKKKAKQARQQELEQLEQELAKLSTEQLDGVIDLINQCITNMAEIIAPVKIKLVDEISSDLSMIMEERLDKEDSNQD
ncbi:MULTISPECIES: hypothetical protein [Streptococcus]|uniref:hypothetical protein n=1 Tax=Streptococcus TaxID=1301 RepID=UPI001C8EA6D2|nr:MULTISPECIES: hypothetical protein [Streptococcus]MBY0719609.1 hypothetical protein [Streptococcus sp. 2018110]MCO8235124.1 hypothetical protein [Streptococcus suis]HEM3552274.1 hypothetical protein [Streptococcus suis]